MLSAQLPVGHPLARRPPIGDVRAFGVLACLPVVDWDAPLPLLEMANFALPLSLLSDLGSALGGPVGLVMIEERNVKSDTPRLQRAREERE